MRAQCDHPRRGKLCPDCPRRLLQGAAGETGKGKAMAETKVRGEPPVSGAEALDAVTRALKRFLYLRRPEQYDALALWIAHTYVYKAFEYTPRLAFTSDGPGSGKTMALMLTGLMVPDVLQAAGMSPAAVRIALSQRRPTLALDETDTIFGATKNRNSDIKTILNVGYSRRDGWFYHAQSNGNDIKPFYVYAPVMFAGIGGLPDTLQTRSISIKMSKPPKGKFPERYRTRLHESMMRATGAALGDWVLSVAAELGDILPEPIDGIEMRTEDIWEPLLVIGTLAGDEWHERARTACQAVVLGTGDPESSEIPPDIALLGDIRTVFAGRDRITSSTLVRALRMLEGSQWGGEWTDVTGPALLADMLRPFGIAPRVMRSHEAGGQPRRGYQRSDFEAVWAARLPAQAEVPAES